jgi:hypothetical protein
VSELGWTVTIDAAGDPVDRDVYDSALEQLLEELVPWSGSVHRSTARDRIGATFSVVAPGDAHGAAAVGLRVFSAACQRASVPLWSVVRLEVLTFAEHDRELEARRSGRL